MLAHNPNKCNRERLVHHHEGGYRGMKARQRRRKRRRKKGLFKYTYKFRISCRRPTGIDGPSSVRIARAHSSDGHGQVSMTSTWSTIWAVRQLRKRICPCCKKPRALDYLGSCRVASMADLAVPRRSLPFYWPAFPLPASPPPRPF